MKLIQYCYSIGNKEMGITELKKRDANRANGDQKKLCPHHLQ
jgi:hypothetical protein